MRSGREQVFAPLDEAVAMATAKWGRWWPCAHGQPQHIIPDLLFIDKESYKKVNRLNWWPTISSTNWYELWQRSGIQGKYMMRITHLVCPKSLLPLDKVIGFHVILFLDLLATNRYNTSDLLPKRRTYHFHWNNPRRAFIRPDWGMALNFQD